MKIQIPSNISSTYAGYSALVSLFHKVKDISFSDIVFDFSKNQWFEANLAAVFGAIIYQTEKNTNNITFENLSPRVEEILQKNHFLYHYGWPTKPDKYNTTIMYQKFKLGDDALFKAYVTTQLLARPDFPTTSTLLAKKINESIFELFENARTHGKCEYIFTCGQYYPTKIPARVDFTIVDIGKSIKFNVNQFLKRDMEGYQTIDWAMGYGNTTKTGNISGGLGLDLINRFIKLNNGKIQVVSSDGYWELRKGITKKLPFNKPFLGTVVNLEFNLDDTNIYQLKEEVSLDNIF